MKDRFAYRDFLNLYRQAAVDYLARIGLAEPLGYDWEADFKLGLDPSIAGYKAARKAYGGEVLTKAILDKATNEEVV